MPRTTSAKKSKPAPYIWDEILAGLSRAITSAVKTSYSVEFKLTATMIAPPPQAEMGDLSFACFALAKQCQQSPAAIAQTLSEILKHSKALSKLTIATVEATGPYINFTLRTDEFARQLLGYIASNKQFGAHKKTKAQRVMVEFSQANTHKAFHIGHVRGTTLGESLSRILETSGDTVLRANYQGDAGMHVAKWMWCYLNFHADEKPRKDEQWIAGIYVESVKRLTENPDLKSEVEEINRQLDAGTNKKLTALWKSTRKNSLDAFEPIYKDLGTHFDQYFFESELETQGKKLVKELVAKKIATVSNGATIVDLEKYDLGVWVLLRSDGTVLYSTKDLVLAQKKFRSHKIDSAIYVVGNAQSLHMKQLFKVLELMKFKQAQNCRHVPVYEVRLPSGKMSSRTGDNILYSEFKQELIAQAQEEIVQRDKTISEKELAKRSHTVALTALTYSMLKQDTNKPIVFNKEEALRFEGDTGPYLLYTYARFKRILTKAESAIGKTLSSDYPYTQEKQLLNLLAAFPSHVQDAAAEYAPAHVARYAYSLAKHLNEYYHTTPVLQSDKKEREHRLYTISCAIFVLQRALYLLGITTIDSM